MDKFLSIIHMVFLYVCKVIWKIIQFIFYIVVGIIMITFIGNIWEDMKKR